MVSREQLESRFYILDDVLYWRNGPLKDRPAGYKNPDGYIEVRVTLDGTNHLIHSHRIIYCMIHGYFPELIDRRNRDTENNSQENLREADRRINAINTGIPSNNTSGYKGVSFHKGRWTAQIKDRGKKYHLGRFKELNNAVVARKKAEEEFWNDIR